MYLTLKALKYLVSFADRIVKAPFVRGKIEGMQRQQKDAKIS
jgi:hypothetical protein